MLIIAGHIEVDPDSRDAEVAAMQEMVGRARATPGCLDLAITADPIDPSRINNFERWESQDALDSWREIAEPPDTGTDILNDHVMLYEIADVRSLSTDFALQPARNRSQTARFSAVPCRL